MLRLGLLTWSVLADYVPGTPGAAWSDQELAETKEKLTYIMENPEKALRQVNFSSRNSFNIISSLASKPIDIRLIRTGSKPN